MLAPTVDWQYTKARDTRFIQPCVQLVSLQRTLRVTGTSGSTVSHGRAKMYVLKMLSTPWNSCLTILWDLQHCHHQVSSNSVKTLKISGGGEMRKLKTTRCWTMTKTFLESNALVRRNAPVD